MQNVIQVIFFQISDANFRINNVEIYIRQNLEYIEKNKATESMKETDIAVITISLIRNILYNIFYIYMTLNQQNNFIQKVAPSKKNIFFMYIFCILFLSLSRFFSFLLVF